jgi:general secretion pathway protein F
LLLLLLLGFAVFKWLLTRPAFKVVWHKGLLRLPLFGKLLLESNTARWARTLSVLLNSGVPAVESLRISAQVLSLLPLQQAVDAMAMQVREGVPLYRALAESKVFPSLVRYLVESGEASGRLPDMLGRVAHHYEVSTQALSGSLIKLIEPVLILVMGGVVLLIVMAILLPIFAMNQLVG